MGEYLENLHDVTDAFDTIRNDADEMERLTSSRSYDVAPVPTCQAILALIAHCRKQTDRVEAATSRTLARNPEPTDA